MDETKVIQINKRACDEQVDASSPKVQKLEVNDNEITKKIKNKNFALMLCYSGKGYFGMQKNIGVETIEDDLLKALVDAKLLSPKEAHNPGKFNHFQRCARTDKGVSAAGQVCNLFMPPEAENAQDLINSFLPDQIRILDIIRTTKSFNCKKYCSYRTYLYTLPSFAFSPIDELVTEDYRIDGDIVKKINDVLVLFKGTHNFYNYTSGKKPNDKSTNRFIVDFVCSDPILKDGMELLELRVKGQSFMLHQIRKMIGITIAVVRGHTDVSAIDRSWELKRIDLPRAPALGLLLDKTHMDWYNNKFAHDKIHKPLEWGLYSDAINKFKDDYIYPDIIQTERNEKSMLNWLSVIQLHTFEYRDSAEENSDEGNSLLKAYFHVKDEKHQKESDTSITSTISEIV